jgi:hypothetical protein
MVKKEETRKNRENIIKWTNQWMKNEIKAHANLKTAPYSPSLLW